jgi:transposase
MSARAVFGIDVDKANLTIAQHGLSAVEVIGNRAGVIVKWLSQLPAGSVIGVESTNRYHELVVRLGQAAGHTVYLLNPRDVRHYALGVGRRGKTDRADALTIARYVAKEMDGLHPYLARSDGQQRMHVLLQQRSAVQRGMTQLRQSLSAYGPLDATFRSLLAQAKTVLRTLDRQIRALSTQAGQGVLFRHLMTVPGIGPVIAACVAHHLQRWPLADVNAWIACTGLDPRPNDSGRKVGRRVLSKRGPPGLRQMLFLAAMTFARLPVGKVIAQRYRARGLSSTATYNIIARMLARLTFSLMKKGQDFDLALFTKAHRVQLEA